MLNGSNVKIRALEKRDFEIFYKWMSNQENLGLYLDANLEYKESFTEKLETIQKDKSRLYAVIEDLNENPIGIMNYREVGGSTTLEIGVLIADSSLRGKGIGKECLQVFTNYLFHSKPIMRIQYFTRVDNVSMIKIGEKIGYISEGILRKYRFEQGSYRDFYIVAITREDWASRLMRV